MTTQIEVVSERTGYGFLHLSDIHFGQERGGEVFINREIKKDLVRFLKDVKAKREKAGLLPVDGVVVTGDIAFSGKANEYRDASEWLAQITDALGCKETSVHVVPGNHDVDRKKISPGVHAIIDQVMEKGQEALDLYLSDETDRERLYDRFSEYRVFAAGYGCRLDREGGAAGTKDFPLRNGLKLRFIGMNSALICRGRDEDAEPGKLFLGAKQRAVSMDDGVEQIILMHHPISWLADGPDSWNYFKNRARIFISGHEHRPDLGVDEIEGNGTVLRIDSGATVPPKGEDGHGYTFNIIDLALDDQNAALNVVVRGYIWDRGTTSFREDHERFAGNHEHELCLPCPRFARVNVESGGSGADDLAEKVAPTGSQEVAAEASMGIDEERFAELRLKYFHSLTPLQRLEILVDLAILPSDWSGSLTSALELSAIEAIAGMGRLDDLEEAIGKYAAGAGNGAGE
ncbi:metallophosphoesterase [Sphingopyxis sp. MG]|uniref:metallophosphoesterase n=1 Tax=Sphingopyxis sp. MG TaxID=1866325 RepID=UPI00131A142D|nr:metallophosphoesterase [Sphingopyxis sp. MG]